MTTLRDVLPKALVKPPVWPKIGGRFGEEKDCLASFIAFEAAEVLGGVKPGNLLNIANRQRACGRNIYELWRKHGAETLSGSSLRVHTLRDKGRAALIYLYREDLLERLIAKAEVADFLRGQGFSPELGIQHLLEEFKSRIGEQDMPPEVGVILGYPVKDVLGFMGCGNEPLSCRGPWQIFGDPTVSIDLVRSSRLCRVRMMRLLSRSGDPRSCLQTMREGAIAPRLAA